MREELLHIEKGQSGEHMKVIGVTGGVGAGKSEALAYLERRRD